MYNKSLWEMAQIGVVNGYQIYVRTDDAGKIPHFHIWDKNTMGDLFHTCVRIDCAKYFHHTGKEGKLNSKMRKSLVNFLQSKDEFDDCTIWVTLLKEWNRNNSNVRIPLDTKMPNYLELE